MRYPLLVLMFLFAATGVGHAQKQERTLQERLEHPDMGMQFDIRRSMVGSRKYSYNAARVKEFRLERNFEPKTYQARDFSGSKGVWLSKLKFWTRNTTGQAKYEIPNANKSADTKTLDVVEARETNKTVATRDVPGGQRMFLGKERDKLSAALDPNNLPRTTNHLNEIKTIDDVRELLNKNK